MTTWIAMTNLATELADGHGRCLVYTEHTVPTRAHAYRWTDAELATRLKDADIKPTSKNIADFRRMFANSLVRWYEEHREEMFELAERHLEVVPSSDGHLYFYDRNTEMWNQVREQDVIRFGEMIAVEPRGSFVCWRATSWSMEMPDWFRPQP
jgi:hypothetical protein